MTTSRLEQITNDCKVAWTVLAVFLCTSIIANVFFSQIAAYSLIAGGITSAVFSLLRSHGFSRAISVFAGISAVIVMMALMKLFVFLTSKSLI